jgi:hypothetical protein
MIALPILAGASLEEPVYQLSGNIRKLTDCIESHPSSPLRGTLVHANIVAWYVAGYNGGFVGTEADLYKKSKAVTHIMQINYSGRMAEDLVPVLKSCASSA